MKPAELAKFVLKQVGFSLVDQIEDKAPGDPLLNQEVGAFVELCRDVSERNYNVMCVVRISFAAQSKETGRPIHLEPQPEFRQRVSVNGELLGDKSDETAKG